MKINNYNELIQYLDKDTGIEKYFSYNNEMPNSFMEEDIEISKLIANDDKKGIFTCFPNEELTKDKFVIRKKLRYCALKEHRHEYIEIVYVLKGSFNQNIKGEIYKMTQGDVCIYDKNTRHASEVLNENHIIVNILLTPEFFDGVFMHLLSDNNHIFNFIVNALYSMNTTQSLIRYHVEEGTTLQVILQHLLIEYFSKGKRSKAAISGYLLIFFAELSRGVIQSSEAVIDKSHTVIKKEVLNYIRDNFKDTNLTTMAEYFHFHPSYLSNLIKKEFGKNLKDLLMEVKMTEVCHLLENTKMTIETIVNEIGYTNSSYFYKIFKKQYGCTPVDYRNGVGR